MYGALALGADHAGYPLKEALKQYLDKHEIPYYDFGCNSLDSVDYPDLAADVARAVRKGEYTQGILCCGSGVGMAIAANRFQDVRAVVCHDPFIASMSRRHNNANVICFGARVIAPEYAEELLSIFLNTPFDGGRHQSRVDKMDHLLEEKQVQC